MSDPILIDGEFSEADDMVVGKPYVRAFVWDGTKLVSGLIEGPTPPETGEPIAPTQAWPKGVRLMQDFTMANAVTPANVTGMSLDLPAGAWILEYCAIHVDSNDQTGHGTRLFFGGPSCFSYTFGAHGNRGLTGNDALPNSLTFPQESAETLTQGQYSEHISSGVGVRLGGAIIKTLIINDEPITVTLQTGQLVNQTNTTTTMKAGSFMTALPINAIAGMAGVVPPELGGNGVANPVEATETVVGAFPRTIRLTSSTDLTLPTSGTLATLTDIPAAPASPTPIDKGGTGATTAAQACINLGVPAQYVPPPTYPKDYGTYRQVDTNCTGVVSFVLNGRMYDFPVTDKGAAPV